MSEDGRITRKMDKTQQTKRIPNMARDKNDVALMQAQADNFAAQTRLLNAQAEELEIKNKGAKGAVNQK